MRIGSLFSGHGGLDMGVQAVLGGDVAWHVEVDKAAATILKHHWPDVPNLGDITVVDWSQVEPVSILTGGFPCQDVSHAGKRAGIRPDTRSGLWSHFAYAIDQLRPDLVVIENVRGLLSAKAHSDVEPCSWCVGDDTDGALRALGAVLGDLAGLGYDARWAGVRAADAGAPHGRFRVFIVAYPVIGDAEGGRWDAPADARSRSDWQSALPARGHGGTPANTAGDEWPWRAWRRGDGPADSGHAPADAARSHEPQQSTGDGGRPAVDGAEPRASHRDNPGHPASGVPVVGRSAGVEWGEYAAAVHRWERTLGRVAPPPTEVGAKGQPRLSPRFVEWMMGLPDGHVTGVDISRNDQLKALGNGVVPEQAELALRWLLLGEWAGVGWNVNLLGTPTAAMTHRSDRGIRKNPNPAEFARRGFTQLLPTPAVNDMGAGKTVEAWDEWTARMKAEHGNGNGHGKSLAVEAQRLGGDAA